jgi:sulfite exporter TauE/SafE
MEPITFWTAVGAVAAVVLLLGGLFAFIRRNDMEAITVQIEQLNEEVSKKLNEDEFRRHEDREEAQLRSFINSSEARFDKLDTKLDRLLDMLIARKVP